MHPLGRDNLPDGSVVVHRGGRTVDAPRFDAFAKTLAVGFPRRRLARGLAALSLAGAAARLVPSPAAAQGTELPPIPLCDCTEC
jgi:hypothetical protein